MSKRDPLFPVYKRLKDRIESDTVGAEITEGEASMSFTTRPGSNLFQMPTLQEPEWPFTGC